MKRMLFLLLAVLMLIVAPTMLLRAEAAEIVDSGTCGEHLTWTLDRDGTLTVSGTGNMDHYNYGGAPWNEHREEVKTVVIEDGVTGIAANAFFKCSSLTGVTIPDSVTSIGAYAFQNCSSLTDVYITDIAAWVSIDFDTLDTNPLGANDLEKKFYLKGERITHLTIPEGITEIGEHVFSGYSNLKSVTLPDSVTEISDSAFYSFGSLESINIPEGVTEIGDFTFEDCSNLKRVNIPDSVTEIGWCAFKDCSSLECITVPDSVTRIDESAFSGCSSLAEVTLGNGVTEIYSWAFSGCSSLKSVTIPDSVAEISMGAFSGCSSLKCVTLGDGVTEIQKYAFDSCSSLTEITLPDSVTEIGERAFYNCSSLVTVHYGGTEEQKADISIYVGFIWEPNGNRDLKGANWHYQCDGGSCPNVFTDVADNAYYYTPVLWAVNNGITNGLSENTFGPAQTCTRGQIVTFLWRAKGSPQPAISSDPFCDVSYEDYFVDAVRWAVENGITSGVSADSFAPELACTRGQVATFLWRAEGQPASGAENIFTDITPDAYYYDAVLWAVENGITNGMGEGIFAPDATCTRGQIVTFLYRAMTE